MQRTKTRQEIFNSHYLSKSDIRKLLDISEKKARKVYELAEEIDKEELGKYRIEDTKVRKKSVIKVYGIGAKDLEREVMNIGD